ncbi:MAG: hypothetical protein ACRCSP_02235 [Rhodoglobus sp.]
MRIQIRKILDCPPDAAWQAIRSTAVLRAVSAPFTSFTSCEPEGFPEVWSAGEHPVAVRAFGIVPLGEQIIAIDFSERADGTRVLSDTGRGTSGPLAMVTFWNHQMAVSATPDGKTLFHDQLLFSAGMVTPIMWMMYWAFWQRRAWRIKKLSARWG